MLKKIANLVLFMLFLNAVIYAQDAQNSAQPKEPVFFFSPMGEYSMYGRESPSFGSGLSIASDGRVAIGLRCLYFYKLTHTRTEGKRIDALEITQLLRVYLLKNKPYTGLFVQFNGGPVIFFAEDDWSIPAVSESFSVGLTLGWRFPLGNYFYIEPAVRGGYPFIVGGGLSAGFKL